MVDPESWITEHEADLEDVADRLDVSGDAVRLTAAMVLHGASDDEIYEMLRAAAPVWNGQHNPIGAAPGVIEEVRRTIGA